MKYSKIAVTGAAGLVGSSLACRIKQAYPTCTVAGYDNLMRRGSELSLSYLRHFDVSFTHCDIRNPEDITEWDNFDLLIDCSAEPSVHAGTNGSPRKVMNVNLNGSINLLEAARERQAAFLFLSTSRVYPMEPLREIPYSEEKTRFVWDPGISHPGISEHGIAEDFPLEGARSFYGSTKLCSELLAQEYAHQYDMPVLINRCGILTGPRQMGKVDQGVITLWVARHIYKRPLRYIGYGGTGKQVRDLLHVDDLFGLIQKQLETPEVWDGSMYNVGGGNPISLSLLELTNLCENVTGNKIEITPVPETNAVDIPIYITDSRKAMDRFSWTPSWSPKDVIADIANWIQDNQEELQHVFCS